VARRAPRPKTFQPRPSEINPTLGRHDAAAEERRKEQRPFASERRKQQGSFGPGAGGERMSGRGGHEHPNEQR